MTIQAQSADGVMHEFPDGTEGAVIDRVMKKYATDQSAAKAAKTPAGKLGSQFGAGAAEAALEAPGKAAQAGETIGRAVGFMAANEPRPRTYPYGTRPLESALYETEKVGTPGEMLPFAQGETTGKLHFAWPEVVRAFERGGEIVHAGLTGGKVRYSDEQMREDAARIASVGVGGEVAPRARLPRAVEAPPTVKSATGALQRGGVEQAAGVAREETGKVTAAAAAPPPEAVVEAQRQVADAAARTRALARSYEEAGVQAQQQRVLLAQAERQAQDAGMAVHQLEQGMLAKPGTTADEFGAQVRQITSGMAEKYARIRSNQSGYKQAIDSAGDVPRVPTEPAHAIIDEHLKNVANPTLKTALKNLTQTFGGAPEEVAPAETPIYRGGVLTNPPPPPPRPRSISVRQADSARKYIDSIIHAKQLGGEAIDAETANALRAVKRSLVESATQAWPPYRQALARWRMLSRPLDIVERNGVLRKVIDKDPVTTDYKLTEAEVARQVISRARAGNPTLLRLASEDPAFKDAARLYFTQDLFGKEAVPTPAAMRTWLRANEAPLKQLGLYNEFRDLRVARETAQRAVDAAKENVGRATAEMRLAEQQRAKARAEAKRAEAAQRQQQKRAEAAQRQADTEKERRVISSTKHASEYQKFESDIRTAPPEKVPGEVRKLIERLYRDGRIDQQRYESAERQIQAVEKSQAAQAAKTDRYKQIARAVLYYGLAGTAAGYAGYKFGKAVSGL